MGTTGEWREGGQRDGHGSPALPGTSPCLAKPRLAQRPVAAFFSSSHHLMHPPIPPTHPGHTHTKQDKPHRALWSTHSHGWRRLQKRHQVRVHPPTHPPTHQSHPSTTHPTHNPTHPQPNPTPSTQTQTHPPTQPKPPPKKKNTQPPSHRPHEPVQRRRPQGARRSPQTRTENEGSVPPRQDSTAVWSERESRS